MSHLIEQFEVPFVRRILVAAMACCLGASASAQIPCRYEVSAIIQGPPCPFTGPVGAFGAGISPNGRYVCGRYPQCEIGDKAFLFDMQAQQFTTLPFPPGVVSMTAAAVNDNAIVVGQMEHSPTGQYQGYLWNSQTGQYTILFPHPGGAWCGVNSINNSNTVCGFRSIGSPNDPVNPYEAFVWTGGVYTNLGVINGPNSSAYAISSNNNIVGFTGVDPFVPPTSAFVRIDGRTTVLPPVPGGTTSNARGISDSGVVAVNGKVRVGSNSVTRAFRYSAGEMAPLLLLPGTNSNGGFGMTPEGTIVGSCLNTASPSNRRWCVWKNQNVYDVGALVQMPQGMSFDGLSNISASGKLIGQCHASAEPAAVVLVPIQRQPGDTNCDGVINIDDLVSTIISWGACLSCPTDFNLDGTVNIDDLVTVILHWTP